MSFIVCVGEALIDFVAQTAVPDIGASEFFRRAAGGAVANVAVGIARLGGDAHFIGALSEDSFGRYLRRTLEHEKVNVDCVRAVDTATTLAFIARGERGERDFFFVRNPGADSRLNVADVDGRDISGARVVHFGGVLLASEPARSACFAAAAAGRRAGAMISYDPNARPSLWSSSEEMGRVLRAGCAAATLVKLSEDDAVALGVKPTSVEELLSDTTRAVIVTRAERGAAFVTHDIPLQEVRAPKVDPVDTTGAGDAFMSALLWRLQRWDYRLNHDALLDGVRYGCAAGAVATLTEGAIPSLPTVAQVESMLARLPHFA